jgi:hypothetical protein
MKKLLSIFIAVLFLSSCGAGEVSDENNELVISGELRIKALNEAGPGTHILSSNDSKDYFVSSVIVNLSDDDFLGNEVELTGVLNDESKLFSVSSVRVLNIVKHEEEKNVSFKKYENFDLGFSIFYYDNWEILENNNVISFFSPKTEDLDAYDLIEIEQFQFNYESSLFDTENTDSPLKSFVSTYHPEISNFDRFFKKIGKNSIDAIEVPNEKSGVDVYIYRNGLIYSIIYLPNSALNVNRENTDIFYEMLNSLELLDSSMDDFADFDSDLSETNEEDEVLLENFETNLFIYNEPSEEFFASFESKSYNFKALYPKNWFYKGQKDIEDGALYSFVFAENDEFEDINYSLSVFNTKPRFNFQEENVSGSTIFYHQDLEFTYIMKNLSNRFYLAKGKNEHKDFMIKSVVSVEEL